MSRASRQRSNDDWRARGASIETRQLIGLRLAARQLRLAQQHRHYARQSGSHIAPFKGRGLSFQQLRAYQGGDEIRHIDWRVTARTTQPHTRLFEEERERPVVLCVDQRQSMAFGSRQCFKSVLACHTAALLAWNALEHNDRVGGFVFSDRQHAESRPRRSQRAVLHFLQQLTDFNQQALAPAGDEPTQALSAVFEELRRITRPGSAVFILSDFHDMDEAAERQLALLARHNDVLAVEISDPMEAKLPLRGHLALSDGRQRLAVDIDGKLQQRYQQDYQRRQETLHSTLRKLGIVRLSLQTSDDVQAILGRELRLQ